MGGAVNWRALDAFAFGVSRVSRRLRIPPSRELLRREAESRY